MLALVIFAFSTAHLCHYTTAIKGLESLSVLTECSRNGHVISAFKEVSASIITADYVLSRSRDRSGLRRDIPWAPVGFLSWKVT